MGASAARCARFCGADTLSGEASRSLAGTRGKRSVTNTQKLETFLSSCFEPSHLARQLQLQHEASALKSDALALEITRSAWR